MKIVRQGKVQSNEFLYADINGVRYVGKKAIAEALGVNPQKVSLDMLNLNRAVKVGDIYELPVAEYLECGKKLYVDAEANTYRRAWECAASLGTSTQNVCNNNPVGRAGLITTYPDYCEFQRLKLEKGEKEAYQYSLFLRKKHIAEKFVQLVKVEEQ